MDKVLSIRNNQQIFSLFNKIQNYQQSLNRTRIINDAIKKALEERKKGTLNWRNIAAISFSLEDFDKRNSPEFIQLRVDLDDYNKIVESMENEKNKYNETMDFVDSLEKEKKALVFAPVNPLKFKSFTTNMQDVVDLYKEGYMVASQNIEKVKKFV